MIKQLFEESARVFTCRAVLIVQPFDRICIRSRLQVRGRPMVATSPTRRRFREDPPLRLTRRGRVVLVVLAAGILLVGLWVTADRGAAAGDRGPAPEMITVRSHDTLWGIATRTRPRLDPRTAVQQIMDRNGLSGVIIQPGQRLAVP
jgi:hypothetical protein